jgi:alpha,alpha-trehalase
VTSTHSNPTILPSAERLAALRQYIKRTWATLTRTPSHIVDAAQDIKVAHDDNTSWVVYISPKEDIQQVKTHLAQELTAEQLAQLDLQTLPAEAEQIQAHGLLYLPRDYVVPGGRFNEMYGWDSYFIVLGLLHDGEIALAQSMTDLFLYEIDHYGTVLNGNRTYMLGRSHPPLLTGMVLRVFRAQPNFDWLRSHLPLIEQYYYYWIVPPHLNAATGLSHYNALGHGPAPEVLASEQDDTGRTHYDRVKAYYRQHTIDDYDVSLYYDAEADELTSLFYQGDRSMRESGFDISDRFGPFSADIIHYTPVCLNVLLYQMEQHIAEMYALLDQPEQSHVWQQRATQRHHCIDSFLWDEAAGQYFDYNFCTGTRRPYEFATTFMPLWAGIASTEQAQHLVKNLSRFEAPGGLLTSTQVSGNQWDAPFGWAPLHYFAILGLHRYGYHQDAERLTNKFVNLVTKEFERSGTIFEKYDVERCSANVSDEIHFGYSSNEIGFGWTNGVVLELLSQLGNHR